MFLVKIPMHNSIYNCVQLKIFEDFMMNFSRSLPNVIKMCRTCKSNVSCESGEIVMSASQWEFVNIVSVQQRRTVMTPRLQAIF